jgi:hypothetical protein
MVDQDCCRTRELPGQTDQVTAKGYDAVTGVGTPNGLAFILGLRRTAR